MTVEVTKFNCSSLEELLEQLVAGLGKECNCEKEVPVASNDESEEVVGLDYFIKSLANKKGWKPEKMAGWLDEIAKLSPMAAFNIMAREIAIFLDHKYEDHIENSDRIFVISSLDGRIHEICKTHVKNYRNFAAFRSIEDAKFACNILREQLKAMFKKNAKKE